MGSETVLAMHAEGGLGNTTRFGVVLPWELEVLAILNGGRILTFPLFKVCGGGVREKVYPCREGGQKVMGPRFSYFVAPAPPLPVINDQSLTLVPDHLYVCTRTSFPLVTAFCMQPTNQCPGKQHLKIFATAGAKRGY